MGLARLVGAGWVVAWGVGLACAPGSRLDVIEVTQDEDVPVGGGPQVVRLERGALNTPRTGDGLKASLKTQLDNQGVSEKDVRSVTLTRVHLEVTEPLAPNGTPRQDLRFLDSLSMYVSSPGMPEVLVAQSVPAPDPDGGTPPDGAVAGATFAAGVFSADVPVASDVELKDYVTAASMTVRTDIVANGKPALSCTVRFSTTMSVQVTAAGVLSRLPLPLP